jgi:AmmeMemoRadiSam system protein B
MSPVYTRKAAVAGSWYPGKATALAEAVDAHLAVASPPPRELEELVAIISPHAGLTYSGPIAAYAYQQLDGRSFDLAVLVGPSHFVGFDGVAVCRSGVFDTPLGPAPIDEACAETLISALPAIHHQPEIHAREHSLEMQLPFLRRVLPDVHIVPLLMGWQTRQTAFELGSALATAVRGRRAVIVASTDLSHYQDRATAARLDAVVIDHVERLDPEGLQQALEENPKHACGGGPTVAAMVAARALGARDVTVLKYGDSGDVSGDTSSVVGYLAAMIGCRSRSAAADTRSL